MKRVQKQRIIDDLGKKMVFLFGPRQSGKTYLAKSIVKERENAQYLNWDAIEDREIIHGKAWIDDIELLVLDELHKMPDWKNYLKGLFDTKSGNLQILVTGSARLDIFKHVGDSLAGRFFCHHLLPLSPSELTQLDRKFDLQQLIIRGGFPEPFLASSNVEADRWRMQYVNSMINIDVLTIDNIQNLGAIRQVFEILRYRVGSSVSIESLARDVAVSHKTIAKYIDVLEALYIVFRVTPFSKNIARSILKEPKIYFFDTALVEGDPGAKFENLVALSLLKHVCAKRDYEGQPYRLHYLRNKDGREVDFALARDEALEQIIEAKHRDDKLSSNLRFYAERHDVEAVQVVCKAPKERKVDGISIVSADRFLKKLDL